MPLLVFWRGKIVGYIIVTLAICLSGMKRKYVQSSPWRYTAMRFINFVPFLFSKNTLMS